MSRCPSILSDLLLLTFISFATVRQKIPGDADYTLPWKGWWFPQEQPSTGSLRELHRDCWVKRSDEPNWLKFERMKIILEEWGQQPPFGGSTVGVFMFWRAWIALLVRTVIDYVAHLAVCALGYRTTYLQAHSSATLGSCPCIPQKNTSKANPGVSVLLQSKSVSMFQSPVQASTLFLCRSL